MVPQKCKAIGKRSVICGIGSTAKRLVPRRTRRLVAESGDLPRVSAVARQWLISFRQIEMIGNDGIDSTMCSVEITLGLWRTHWLHCWSSCATVSWLCCDVQSIFRPWLIQAVNQVWHIIYRDSNKRCHFTAYIFIQSFFYYYRGLMTEIVCLNWLLSSCKLI